MALLLNTHRPVVSQVPQYAVDGLRALVECGDPVSQDNLNCLSDSLLRRHLLDPTGALRLAWIGLSAPSWVRGDRIQQRGEMTGGERREEGERERERRCAWSNLLERTQRAQHAGGWAVS